MLVIGPAQIYNDPQIFTTINAAAIRGWGSNRALETSHE